MARRNPPPSEPLPPLPPLIPASLPRFVKDLKRQEKNQSPERMEKLYATIELLRTHQTLPPSYHEHMLRGKWEGCHECHIGGEGDWLLVYKRSWRDLILVRVESMKKYSSRLDRQGAYST